MSPFVDRFLVPFDRLIAIPAIWRVVEGTIIRFARGLRRRRNAVHVERLRQELAAASVVQMGPFEGMRYATLQATCSAILPKLLGTYELELAPAIDRILQQSYECVVDVGCAEGYYAVGFARRFPLAQVVAFDIDPRARELCQLNAAANGISDQMSVLGAATPSEVANLCRGRRTLIVCDCEGYERDLFPAIPTADLLQSDLLIETHDFIHQGVHELLLQHFAATHEVYEFHSIDDRQKARTYQTSWTTGMDEDLCELVFAEGRPVIMRWLILVSRAGPKQAHNATSSIPNS
jgi:SAM-dependent methyltransferase